VKIGFLIYGSLDILSGGYFYDRRLVTGLEALGDKVDLISIPWRSYLAHLGDNLHFRFQDDLDVLIQDELSHPSLIMANKQSRDFPVVSLVHHLRSSEKHPWFLKGLYRKIEMSYLESVDAFIFNSNTTRHVVEKIVENKKPFIVGYPPTNRFNPKVDPKTIKLRAERDGPLQLIFLGNVIPRKGLDVLIQAIEMSALDIRLDVVGSLDFDKKYANQMQSLVERSDLRSKIRFHGALSDRSLEPLMQKAQLLVLPSTYEGFGIVYLEGMSFGLPAIGTTSGAASEIIDDGRNGFLVPGRDFATLAGKLELLSKDRSCLAEMSVKALQRFQQQPGWSETVQKIRGFLSGEVVRYKSSML
jgi:glycosyltransferase involved in cell wall biosynthesis